jgi:hypothetical protein
LNSHFVELRALMHIVDNCSFTDRILVWITDSQSAVYSANKGACRDTNTIQLLSAILAKCDSLHLLLIAIWVPRELNLLPDFLGHFATSLNRVGVSGRVGTIDAMPQDSGK